MKKSIILRSVFFAFFAYFACFVCLIHAGDATLTLDDNSGSSSFVVQDVDKTNQFKVNSDGQGYFAGNVGIGAMGTGAKLDVVGTIRFGTLSRGTLDETAGDPTIDLNTGANYLYIRNTSDDVIATFTNAGNVGIGTVGPEGKLHLSQPTGTVHFFMGNDNSQDSAIYASDDKLSLYANAWGSPAKAITFSIHGTTGGESMRITDTGKVGIGTTSPSEKLEVSGNIKASGTVSQGSSKEFKKNISYVSTKDAMNALNKLNPVRFEYKTDESGERHLGFIAEDVPDLVAEEDRKHLNAMDITAVLTKVVQEQQKMIALLSVKVKSLEEWIGQN